MIPDTAAEKPIRGKVVAVGKGKILENGKVRPLDVKVGDKILFGKYSGTEVKVDGEELPRHARRRRHGRHREVIARRKQPTNSGEHCNGSERSTFRR